jgi:hypothetical protein
MLCFAKLSHWQNRTSRTSVNVDVVAVAVAVALIVIIILTANLRLSVIISVRGGKAVVGVFQIPVSTSPSGSCTMPGPSYVNGSDAQII